MLSKVGRGNHIAVGIVIAVMVVLAGLRIVGAGDDARFRAERFDSKQVTIWPEGDDGVRLREVVDIDFGHHERRGYQRIIPNDFGVPESITVSTDADDTVNVVDMGGETRIRVGDPDVTFTGRHRYELEYVLPDAQLGSGVLALDVIGHDETFVTDRFEVVLTGFDFETTACDTGSYGSFGGCELTRDDSGRYVAIIEPLEPNDGITVGGRIRGFTDVDVPAAPAPRTSSTGFAPLGLLMIPIGIAGAACAFLWSRRRGSNDISGAGGAADAAFGALPQPGVATRTGGAAGSTRRVTDKELARMATIEFVPPRGLEPWQGAALLQESVGDDTVLAWFSDMIAQEALVVVGEGSDAVLRLGPREKQAALVDQVHLARLFAAGATVELGTYDADFAATWQNIADEQQSFIDESGWWNRSGGRRSGISRIAVTIMVIAGFGLVFFGVGTAVLTGILGTVASPWFAVVLGFGIPFLAAAVIYSAMLPSRTATGSALALRTESFRRFLSSSEGRHVEWAWEHKVLREYSAWAVALGAADAWTKAISASNIPDPTVAMAGPMLVHSMSSSFSSTHVAPSSSGGSSGGFSGGFSGGSGGGGGGGSSGSW